MKQNIMSKLWQTSKVKTRQWGIKSMRSHKQKAGYFKYVYVRTKGHAKRIEKLVIRSVSTKWMAPNKRNGIFFVH